jgi:hypothetical protein
LTVKLGTKSSAFIFGNISFLSVQSVASRVKQNNTKFPVYK